MSTFTMCIEGPVPIITMPTINRIPATSYRPVGRSTVDQFFNKTIIDPSNTVAANQILVGGSTPITVTGELVAGLVLTLVDGSTAQFAVPTASGGHFFDDSTTINSASDFTRVLNFNIGGTTATTTTLVTSPTVSRQFVLPDLTGTALAASVGGIIHTTIASVVTLVAGSATVANTHIPAGARITLTIQPGATPLGIIWVSAITTGVSFVISSTNGGDTCTVFYQIFAP